MNFDKLKSEWDKENIEIHIPNKIDQLKKSQHPIEQIQKNMKKEFFMQIIAIIFVGFFPILLNIPSSQYIIYYISYIIFVVISVYYFLGFYKFYKQTELYTANTKSSLWKIYYELKLNMERYQSFGFLLLPQLFVIIGFIFYNNSLKNGKNLFEINNSSSISLIVFALVSTLIYVTIIVAWTKYVYGSDAKKLENIINEIEE